MPNSLYPNEILYLKFPKLISNYSRINPDISSLEVQSGSLANISSINGSKKHSTNHINKFDKKYKNNLNSEDILELKKNKNKSAKKIRKSSILDTKDLLIDDTNNFYDRAINNYKINKNKKKDKDKSFNRVSLYSSGEKNIDTDLQVSLPSPLSIQDLSTKLNIPEAELITYLFLKGVSVTINDFIDTSIAKEIALNYNFKVVEDEYQANEFKEEKVSSFHSKSKKTKRSPIITILGHVDHGKTTLLDSIMKTNLVEKEYGGITQSISGYEVEWLYQLEKYKLVFLDTPGHEAFESMRLRGAKVTDIALLVVAADDGLKPQSVESIKYILSMKLAYIVVINKIDKIDIDIIKIKKELASHGMVTEEWGGDSIIVEVSALTGQNIDILLSSVCLLAELNSFTAEINQPARGTILEAYLDKKKGILANAINQEGTLKLGDFIVAGKTYGKVKSLLDITNKNVSRVYPSSIVQILAFSKPPQSGTIFFSVSSEKEARQLTSFNDDTDLIKLDMLKSLNKKVSGDSSSNTKQLSLILKTDTQGTLEALVSSLAKISQEKVQINLVKADIGNISSTDIELALASDAIIIGFCINSSTYIDGLIKQYKLIFVTFNVIYNLLDYIYKCMLDLVELEYEKIFLGEAVVQTVFFINKRSVAGCLVKKGKLKKMSYIYVYDNNAIFYEGVLTSLKRLKDDVDEVLTGNECGIMCKYDSWKVDNTIKAYDLKPKEKTL
uniref:Translation initiation factor IF-2, chloroplastic n=1 Tax=Caloglossa intermedia TaxID=100879 RepID=A0A1Z1M5T6_9FLOR|nr:translation initiation factor 2 [Caloglossa intermedia]ARW61457.1 translation initiation factor 2 [Caloglossa intermedia]